MTVRACDGKGRTTRSSTVVNVADEPRLLAEPRGGVPEVITTLDDFRRMVQRFAMADGSVAADAERASGFRYGHEDWLVQFKREGAGIALVDPVVLAEQGANWADFNLAVGDSAWIIHDSLQDLPGFADLGMRPKALFDTEMAARLLGLSRFGLAAVTEHYLGLTLAKEHSAADWSYRPLPRDWRNYAALDVELLIELEDRMGAELKRQGKDGWAREEFSYLLAKGMEPKERPVQPWRHISHINALARDQRGLAVARGLWTRRDEIARHYDIAPSLLLPDAAIIEAAQRKPRNAREFRAIRSLNERVRVHTGGEQDKMFERYAPIQREVKPVVWKDAIAEALALRAADLPVSPPSGNDEGNAPRSMRYWQDHHPARYARLQAARKVINQIADDTRTPADVIVKPQLIRNLCWTDDIRSRDVAEFLHGQGARRWQVDLIAASVTRAIM
ncbi:HRDC domain-containing protein [Bifidobacterium vespertilionis]|uniref:HRDC domain-containing protein n=1 Tax=Bifidobacterium vespertilionis TaxID=2562524 RepID=UPI001BDCD63D|nr:HRDC domain-containing protein [Bifidobacterium vespertilionis]MBT1178206.1 HRDC domain-containing protein [Bifidobacterium vespertilionis]